VRPERNGGGGGAGHNVPGWHLPKLDWRFGYHSHLQDEHAAIYFIGSRAYWCSCCRHPRVAFLLDEPLRKKIEADLNHRLKGYSVRVGRSISIPSAFRSS